LASGTAYFIIHTITPYFRCDQPGEMQKGSYLDSFFITDNYLTIGQKLCHLIFDLAFWTSPLCLIRKV